MTRRQFLSAAGALAAVTASSTVAPCGGLQAAVARPNLILILVDDLGCHDWGCTGHPYHETPNIDRLASQGVQFTNAYAACPVCSPTRAAVMTGQYPARLHITDWIPGRKQWPTAKLLTPQFEQQLPLQAVTIAETLRPLGYKTASIGKWHLGAEGFAPTAQGFDLNVAGTKAGSPPNYFGPFDLPNLKANSKDEWLTAMLTQSAQAFIKQSGANPFFLYLPHYTVHTPLQAPSPLVEKYQKKISAGGFTGNATYAAMMETLDQSVGALRATLEEQNLWDKTVLLITSDNGGLRFEGKAKNPVTSNAPQRAGKGHLFEGGIRAPMIVTGPGVPAGKTEATPVCSIDFLPTFAELAGAKLPGLVDGISFAKLLSAKGGKLPQRPLFWHYPHYSNQGGSPGGAVRQGPWKLIEFYEDGRLELFHLEQDPSERVNLASKEKATAARLHALLRAWRTKVNATMPTTNPAYDATTADQGLTGVEAPTSN